jgi:arginine utilization protein RocB
MDNWEATGMRVMELAERLVRTPSVVGSAGEGEMGHLLAGYLREQAAGLERVYLHEAKVDKPNDCVAVLAYCPAPVDTARTLILMGHTDTVGLEPYGSLAQYAFDSAALKKEYMSASDDEVRAAARSQDWNFGRGWLDMKGGVAAIVEVFLREARLIHAGAEGALPAHLVLLLTPDEEDASRGARTLLPELIRLKQERGLEFARVVNADYIAPIEPGDENKYLYSGTVGKLLLGVSVFGRTTHAGETFNGVNASALGGYLAYALEHDRKLLAGAGGEWLPPPTVLHAADRRTRYDVMTADSCELYVNVFHTGRAADILWREIRAELRRLVKQYDREMRRRYQRFIARADLRLPRYEWPPEVIDFAGLKQRVAEAGHDVDAKEEWYRGEAQAQFDDDRERGFHIVRGLHGELPPGRPLVVASLLPPYYPASVADKRDPATLRLSALCEVHGLKHRRVYPYISDMSYFSFGRADNLAAWSKQAPLWFNAAELAQYETVTAPVLNLGPWGVGAHRWEERVYVPFLRDELPRLLSSALHALAEG